jgi:Mycothiol maleylpyruvate isomerase N-terminal domain
MSVMRGTDVLAAADAAIGFLEPLAGRDWSRAVPGLDFTVASVMAHAACGPLWYAIDFTGGPGDDGAFEIGVRADAEPVRLLVSLRTTAALCAMTVDSRPPGSRGFHPAGSADASGFAAMACDEILVHTRDAGTGLGESFRPDPGLAGLVLTRLFPWQDPVPDPWAALLHANGRIELPGRPRRQSWTWHCAPLDEWDGAVPSDLCRRGGGGPRRGGNGCEPCQHALRPGQ